MISTIIQDINYWSNLDFSYNLPIFGNNKVVLTMFQNKESDFREIICGELIYRIYVA